MNYSVSSVNKINENLIDVDITEKMSGRDNSINISDRQVDYHIKSEKLHAAKLISFLKNKSMQMQKARASFGVKNSKRLQYS